MSKTHRTISLFLTAMGFIYLTAYLDHNLTIGLWYSVPTILISGLITVICLIGSLFSFIDDITDK
jgi:hypothetical protein